MEDPQQRVDVEVHPASDVGLEAQCPVAHAPTQPLPPGHPAVKYGSASTLKPPSDPKCVFFRTFEDISQTPPLSRKASVQLAAAANINPLKPEDAPLLNLDTTLVLASRNSQLALVQSSHVSAMLDSHYGEQSPAFASTSRNTTQDSIATPPASPPSDYSQEKIEEYQSKVSKLGIRSPFSFPITSMSTSGDQNQKSPLYVIGGEGKAIWTKELEVALAGGAVDAIVHCLKDIPTTLPEGLMLAAILQREDPRDALVIKSGLPYKTLDDLPPGSVIGTSSVRRVSQLRRRYPELVFSDVRGNLNTRLSKLDSPTGPYTALVLAAAGLIRLSLSSRINAFLSAPVLMHSVGQGSLAIEVRRPPPGAVPETNRDARIVEMIRSIGDWRATWRQEAERSLLKQLEGGCSIPVGVDSRFDDHDKVEGELHENEAVRDVDRKNGRLDSSAEPIVLEGHTIPVSQWEREANGEKKSNGSARNGDQPPPLKRLATENDVQISSTTAITTPQPVRMQPEDRATEPSVGHFLTLTAIVVSLDGTRDCKFALRRECKSVEDARNLGIEVAIELAQKRGAKVILEEVERHRKLAEEADNRRRQMEKDRRIQSARQGDDGILDSQVEMGEALESRRMLEEALKSAEVDRRGLPRDDGQLKAWEV
jgi:hydroxymethylbilane synthase